MDKYKVEHQYQLYLKRVNLEEGKMPPVQRKELRNAFYAAWGQSLILMRDDISRLPDDTGYKILDSQLKEIGNYFLEIKGQVN